MKQMSARELRLLMVVGGLLLAMVSFVVVKTQLQKLGELNVRRDRAQLDQAYQDQVFQQRPVWLEDLQRIQALLPRRPEGRDITTGLLRQIRNLAAGSGLNITDQNPQPENFLEELGLYQTGIECSWQGSREELVGFLKLMQDLGAVIDVKELRFRNRARNSLILSGDFTLEFVYSRTAAEITPAAPGESESPL
jgi:hypothetical protein